MSKIKTKRAAAKRFKITGSGRIKRGQAGARHNTGKKRSKSMRNLGGAKILDRTNERSVLGSLPNYHR